MTGPAHRPLTLLIAALGGEGGGVLTDWIVDAASRAGFPVQSTSIPGVAQRTGATTYYVEIFPQRTDELGGRAPVMALYPAPGNIDLMVASELLEAGRAMENGYVSPDRTTLVASTHRVYAIGEKSAMGDGIYDGARVEAAAQELARRPLLADFRALAQEAGSVTNAVLLGVIAGSGALPIPPEDFERAIRARGVAVDANLAGFAAGLTGPSGNVAAVSPATAKPAGQAPQLDDLLRRVAETFPTDCHAVLEDGVRRLVDYQDSRYAGAYMERLLAILAADEGAGGASRGYALTREAGRFLALWMSYEDVVRVADLKTRRSRLAALRAEVSAKPGEPVHVTEFLKPGVEEVAALLPPGLGRRLLAFADRRGGRGRWHVRMRVRTDTVLGFLRLRALAELRGWRRHSHRFAEEQALMDRWLAALVAVTARDYGFALELAECANLLKGYGETHRRGQTNFLRILDEIVEPVLTDTVAAGNSVAVLGEARKAALADPEGNSLATVLDGLGAPVGARAAAE